MLQKLIKKNIDTAQPEKKRKLQAMATVKDLANHYMRERASYKRVSSQEMDKYVWKYHILPILGALKVSSLDHSDIAKFHHSFQGRPITGNRVLALLSKALHLAELWGYRLKHSSLCLHIKKYDEQKQERLLTQDEMARLLAALESEEKEGQNPWGVYAIRLLLLTGHRLSEILNLMWTEVDFENKCLHLRDSKTGKNSASLSIAALELLKSIPQNPNNPFVVCREGEEVPLANLKKFWRQFREKIGLEDVHLYDLRYGLLPLLQLSLSNKSA